MNGKPVITKKLADALALGVNGSYSNEGNALQHTLYDSVVMPAALGATTNYFTQPIGAAYGAGNKTINETNLSDPGKLPNGQTFLVTAMSFAIKPQADTVAGAANALFNDFMSGVYGWISNSIFEIVIAGREYEYQVPGTELLPTIPMSTVATAATQRIGDYWTSGWCKLNATPIVIGQLVSFQVRQIYNASQVAAVNTQVNAAMAEAVTQAPEAQIRLRGYLTRSI
jgi:hypothetical protein